MTCRRIGGGIVCSRGHRRRPRLLAKPDPCLWPGCDRAATQASWGCRPHWFKLPPDIRSRLWRADRDERAANGRLGRAWAVVDEEARAWVAEREAKPPRTDRRQPELPL